MARGVSATRLAAALFCVSAFSAEAWARTETLHWSHDAPSTVDMFYVYWTPAGGTETQVPVQKNQDSQGFVGSVNVSDGVNVTFAVSAYSNQGGESGRSNSICRDASSQPCSATTAGGGTTGGGTTGGGTTSGATGGGTTGGGTTAAQAAIVGFKLWDATNDVVITNDFTGADPITSNCVSIEILGNAYLTADNGSLKKQLNNAQVACNTPGIQYENDPPFAWEDGGSTGIFACAATLQTNGQYSLTVTPYDGKNCTGTQGTPVTVNFTVNVGAAPATGSLGTPGKPYLVQ